MVELGEPWDEPDAEYQALKDFLFPAAQASYARATQDWNALDTKTFGFLAIVAAVIAGLVAVHEAVHPLWWIPTAGCVTAGILFIASTWPRTADLGPDLVDFHDELRDQRALATARAMVTHLVSATEQIDDKVAGKGLLFLLGLGVLSISLLGCLPVVVFRP